MLRFVLGLLMAAIINFDNGTSIPSGTTWETTLPNESSVLANIGVDHDDNAEWRGQFNTKPAAEFLDAPMANHRANTDIFVDQSAPPGGDGTSWTTAFQTIEEAVNVAAGNNTIFIAEGIYRPIATQTITVPLNFEGGFPAGGGVQDPNVNITQVQADFDPMNVLGVLFDIEENATSRFTGLNFQEFNGAIQSRSNLLVDQCVFLNSAGTSLMTLGNLDFFNVESSTFDGANEDMVRAGGTITDVTLLDVLFTNGNSAALDLGGTNTVQNIGIEDAAVSNFDTSSKSIIDLRGTTAAVENLLAENNRVTGGASILIFGEVLGRPGSLQLNNSEFMENSVESTVFLRGSNGSLSMENTIFAENLATGGGSVLSIDSAAEAVLQGNTFTNNQVTDITLFRIQDFIANGNRYSGEVNLKLDQLKNAVFTNEQFSGNTNGDPFLSLVASTASLENCLMVSTQTSGNHTLINSDADVALQITNCTFSAQAIDNVNVRLGFGSNVPSQLRNSIIWSGPDLTTSGLVGDTSNLTIFNSLVRGEAATIDNNLDGTTIDNAPEFVDPAAMDFSMLECSPTVNMGDNSFAVLRIDLPGNPRIIELSIDLGAYELQVPFNNTCSTPPTPPSCTTLLSPMDGAEVPAGITRMIWNPASNATQYRITITGTANNDIIDLLTPDTFYDFPGAFVNGETVAVTIVPLNGNIEPSTPCDPQSFTIEATTQEAPDCTELSNITSDAVGVDIATNFEWPPVAGAEGYRIMIGTVTRGANVANEDVRTATFFDLPFDLDENQRYFVTIVPYIGDEDATGCSEIRFTTGTAQLDSPACTSLDGPFDMDTDIQVDTIISWVGVPNAAGYRLLVINLTDGAILFNGDVGNVTSFDLPDDLPEASEISVTITPYNADGDAESCTDERFMTVMGSVDLPICTPQEGSTNVAPNVGFTWDAVGNIDGYLISIGTITGGNDILGPLNVGLTTTYQPEGPLPPSLNIFVTITPFNEEGNAVDCSSTSFRTVGETASTGTILFGFSPNGDGINDFWTINGIEEYPTNTVTIYNRWGDAVFKTVGYDNATNVFRGEANQLTTLGAGKLPEDTYFFNIGLPENHNLSTTQGYVVLKR